MKIIKLIFIPILLVFVINCAPKSADSIQRTTNKSTEAVKKEPTSEFKIINKETISSVKYSVNLEIAKEIEENQIQTIFNFIKNENPGYERYFVHFFLPGMKPGSGAWATANYDRTLIINILGLTSTKIKDISARTFDESIGVWKDNFMGTILHLKKENNEYYIENEFDDDSSFKKKVIYQSGDNSKFIVPESPSGDYYVIISNFLEVWDDDGKISRYDIIKEPEMDLID